jgi:hypothetical protein
VTGNHIAGGSGKVSVAAVVSSGGATLDGNGIVAGCGGEQTTGVLLAESAASLVNNRIQGGACGTGTAAGAFYGVRALRGDGAGELLIHSNDVDPAGSGDECKSMGISFERLAGDGGEWGILRNNIVAAGNCKSRVAVFESSNAAARVIENNDLYPGPQSPSGAVTALYRRSGADVTSIDQVNKLGGAAGNISANPKFVSYPDDLHLTSESPCIDKGTAVGAPALDGSGMPRPQGDGYDIGAFEYVSP